MTRIGGFSLDDPRPIAAEAPYTFILPSEVELDALEPGDLVKIVVRAVPPSEGWGAERMWVTVGRRDGDVLQGCLDSNPDDIPALRPGAMIRFARHHVIDIIWGQDRAAPAPPRPEQHTYWDRCLVDLCVTVDKVPVHYLYREQPSPTGEGEIHADSGWRIRGDYRGLSDEEIDARESEFVALGRVLNCDDSWIHLIDAPIGSAFVRDWETGGFVPAES